MRRYTAQPTDDQKWENQGIRILKNQKLTVTYFFSGGCGIVFNEYPSKLFKASKHILNKVDRLMVLKIPITYDIKLIERNTGSRIISIHYNRWEYRYKLAKELLKRIKL